MSSTLSGTHLRLEGEVDRRRREEGAAKTRARTTPSGYRRPTLPLKERVGRAPSSEIEP